MKQLNSFMVKKVCTCFKTLKDYDLGLLSSDRIFKRLGVKEYENIDYNINDYYRCRNFLIKFYNDKYGKIWSDRKRSGAWNYDNHPRLLQKINDTKEWISKIKVMSLFKENKQLYNWLKTLDDHQFAVIVMYFLIINNAFEC